jgi:LysR family transcriptional regulator, nitrogen assimilation regulatory protein
VVDLGGFSRAARVLGIAQPALSRHVRGLEVELGQTLLLRNGRGAVPTEAGKRLLEHARGILQQMDRARHEVAETRGAVVGQIVVGMPPTVALHLAVPIVREFRQRYPKATLGIAEGLSATLHEWLLVGRVDIGIVYNPIATPAVDTRTLLEEPLTLVGPAERRAMPRTVRLADLTRFPLIIPRRPNAIRMLVENGLAALGLRPQIAMEIDAIPAILELVAEGHGHAVLSPRALARADAGLRLASRPIVRPPLSSMLAIATSAQRPSTPIQKATVALIEEIARQAW